MRRLIMGDLHGSLRALEQVLEMSGYDKDEDELYFTGDLADGYPDVVGCIRLLRTLPRFHAVIGNHDIWLQNWLVTGQAPLLWTMQGGEASIGSFERAKVGEDERMEIAEWFRSWPYVLSLDDCYIMHGGPGGGLCEEELDRLAHMHRPESEGLDAAWDVWSRTAQASVIWDRDAYMEAVRDTQLHPHARKSRRRLRSTVFVGHTEIPRQRPFISRLHGLVNVDTGAGSYGRLTILDMDTMRWFSSDRSMDLYGFCSIRR